MSRFILTFLRFGNEEKCMSFVSHKNVLQRIEGNTSAIIGLISVQFLTLAAVSKMRRDVPDQLTYICIFCAGCSAFLSGTW
jgi:hypothetical protein